MGRDAKPAAAPGGLGVAELGCGFGWFCRRARAARVLGLDVSARMLERARATTRDAAITDAQADLEALALPAARFDLVHASLAFHDVAAFGPMLATIHQVPRPGGRLVFSVEHPVFTAPREQAWRQGADGRMVWPLDGYFAEGPRARAWFVPGVVKQHRGLATTLNAVMAAGFGLERIEEFGPGPAQLSARPAWTKERERPMFLLVSARA